VDSPAFGQADLSNCERELIHLAGSVQPHGVLLLLSAGNLVVLQASRNCAAVLGQTAEALLEEPLSALDAGLAQQVLNLLPDWAGEPLPLLTQVNVAGKPSLLEGTVADAIVQSVRDLTGYDRVMVYRFDPDGHGKIIAEARDPRLESLLGHHYPATDIPQRARELYLRNRVRMLVDVTTNRSRWCRRCAPTRASRWTCRCARCAACRRCTCSTCATWASPARWWCRWCARASCGA
jgi:chemotaxis family two-component system sensor kinase Cph1